MTTLEDDCKLVSARNPEPPAGYYIGDVFITKKVSLANN